MAPMGTGRWALVSVAVILLGLVAPSPASATGTLTWADLAPVFHSKQIHVFPGRGATGTEDCPKGWHVLTGGAWFNHVGAPPDGSLAATTWLSNSFPTASGWKA